jgi:hypothetical protein
MITAWILWLYQVHIGSAFTMPAGFKILASPSQETVARMTLTDAAGEFAFLDFSSKLHQLRQNLALYNFTTSICGMRTVLVLIQRNRC